METVEKEGLDHVSGVGDTLADNVRGNTASLQNQPPYHKGLQGHLWPRTKELATGR